MEEKKKSNAGLIVLVVILLLACAGMGAFIFVNKVYGVIQLFVILVYPLLKLYNGKKGNSKFMKWFFYIYYPLHLFIIGLLRLSIYGDISLLFN